MTCRSLGEASSWKAGGASCRRGSTNSRTTRQAVAFQHLLPRSPFLIEPRGVLNTGHEGGDRTAANDVWI